MRVLPLDEEEELHVKTLTSSRRGRVAQASQAC